MKANFVIFSVILQCMRAQEIKKFKLLKWIVAIALFVLPRAAFAQGIDNLMLDALALYQNGQFKAAKQQLQDLSKAAPENDAVWYYLALTEVELGEAAPAINHMAKAAELDSGNYWYRQRLSILYAATGNTAKQIDLLEAIKRDFPDKALSTAYELVNLYIDTKRYDDALEALDEVEKGMGESEQTVRTRYDLLRNMGRDEDAAELLEEFAAGEPSAPVLSMLGDYYLDYDRDSLALDRYEKALSLEPGYIPALLGKSEVYRQTYRTKEYFDTIGEFMSRQDVPVSSKSLYINNALRAMDPRTLNQMLPQFDSLVNLAVAAHPTDTTLLQTAGIYCYATGRSDKACRFFKANADLYPDSQRLEAAYEEMLGYSGDWAALQDRAVMAYSRFKNWQFLDYASSAAYQQKDYQAVIDYNSIKIKESPDTLSKVSGWAAIGDMYYTLGKRGKAFKAYGKALKLNPDYVPVLNNYAYYLAINGGCLKKAAKMAARAVELAPDEGTYLDTYGWILHLQKKDAEAKPLFQRCMVHGGKESAVLLDHYAEVLFSLGEYDLARIYWQQAKAKNTSGQVPDLDERVAKRETVMSGGGK